MNPLNQVLSGANFRQQSLQGVSNSVGRSLSDAKSAAMNLAGKVLRALAIGGGVSLAAVKAAPTLLATIGGVAGVKAAIKAAAVYSSAMKKFTTGSATEQMVTAAKVALREAGASLAADAVKSAKTAFGIIRDVVVGVAQTNRVDRSIEKLERMSGKIRRGLTELGDTLGPALVKEVEATLARVHKKVMVVKEGTHGVHKQMAMLTECRDLYRQVLTKLAVRESLGNSPAAA